MAREKVITPECTISYPALFEPKLTPSGDEKYSACLIFDKDADLSKLKTAVTSVATDRWGPKAAEQLRRKQLRAPFRDGAEKAGDGYGPGKMFVNASSNRQPGVVDRFAGSDGKPRVITDPDEIYPGCRVRASLLPFAYEVQGNKGVSFLLGNVQKLGDGPRLDGRRRAQDEFDALEAAPTDLDPGFDSDGELIEDDTTRWRRDMSPRPDPGGAQPHPILHHRCRDPEHGLGQDDRRVAVRPAPGHRSLVCLLGAERRADRDLAPGR